MASVIWHECWEHEDHLHFKVLSHILTILDNLLILRFWCHGNLRSFFCHFYSKFIDIAIAFTCLCLVPIWKLWNQLSAYRVTHIVLQLTFFLIIQPKCGSVQSTCKGACSNIGKTIYWKCWISCFRHGDQHHGMDRRCRLWGDGVEILYW